MSAVADDIDARTSTGGLRRIRDRRYLSRQLLFLPYGSELPLLLVTSPVFLLSFSRNG